MLQQTHKTLEWLAKPVLLHWLLPYLMALVLVGTVTQKYIGLFESQRLFFSSFIFWAGPLPLPGGRLVTAFMLISLLAKIFYASPWHKEKVGIFISHLGVLLLLLGGLVTAAFSNEGYMLLNKNQDANHFLDYHQRVLTISKNSAAVITLPLEDLRKTRKINDASLPFTVTIDHLCRNCTMALREGDSKALKGSAQKVMLTPIDGYLEDERNLSGIEFTVEGAGDANGTYIAFEPMDKQASFTIANTNYDIRIGRETHALPFSLELIDAQKEVHPGTTTPRSYRSTVLLSDGELKQRAVISMNHPLRYKGYTVYQASFNQSVDTEQTQSVSFAVVQNSGRAFPYIASITLCIGLMIHLFLRLPKLMRKRPHAC
jgi:hypothetical protein